MATKRVKEESNFPVSVRSSSLLTAPPKMGAGQQVSSLSKLHTHGHPSGEKGSLSPRRSANPKPQKPGYAAPAHTDSTSPGDLWLWSR